MKVHVYFASYAYETRTAHGYGAGEFGLSDPIASKSDVDSIVEFIKEQRQEILHVTILFFSKLREDGV